MIVINLFHRSRMVCCIVFCLYFIIINTNVKSQNNIETILEGIKYEDGLIFSGKGTFIYEFTIKDSLFYKEKLMKQFGTLENIHPYFHVKWKILIIFKNNKIFVEKYNYNEKTSSPFEIYAYNGIKLDRLFLNKDSKGIIVPSASIKYDLSFFPSDCDPLNNIKISSVIEQAIKGEFNGKKVKIDNDIKDEKIDEIPCKVVVINENENNYYKYWLAEKMYYRPIKTQTVLNNNIIDINVKYMVKNKDIIYPSYILKKTYNNVDNKLELERIFECTMNDDWEFNIELPDSIFNIKYPKGLYEYGKTE